MFRPLVTPVRKISIENVRSELCKVSKKLQETDKDPKPYTFLISFCESSDDVVVTRHINLHPNAVRNRDEVFDFLMKMEG